MSLPACLNQAQALCLLGNNRCSLSVCRGLLVLRTHVPLSVHSKWYGESKFLFFSNGASDQNRTLNLSVHRPILTTRKLAKAEPKFLLGFLLRKGRKAPHPFLHVVASPQQLSPKGCSVAENKNVFSQGSHRPGVCYLQIHVLSVCLVDLFDPVPFTLQSKQHCTREDIL